MSSRRSVLALKPPGILSAGQLRKFQHASSRFCARTFEREPETKRKRKKKEGKERKKDETKLNLFNIHLHESRASNRVEQRFNDTFATEWDSCCKDTMFMNKAS